MQEILSNGEFSYQVFNQRATDVEFSGTLKKLVGPNYETITIETKSPIWRVSAGTVHAFDATVFGSFSQCAHHSCFVDLKFSNGDFLGSLWSPRKPMELPTGIYTVTGLNSAGGEASDKLWMWQDQEKYSSGETARFKLFASQSEGSIELKKQSQFGELTSGTILSVASDTLDIVESTDKFLLNVGIPVGENLPHEITIDVQLPAISDPKMVVAIDGYNCTKLDHAECVIGKIILRGVIVE